MKKCYHITKKSNLKSILEHGLIPSIGENSLLCDENKKLIYCFHNYNDLIDGLTNWLGDLFDDIELICIEIDYTNLSYNINAYEIVFLK